ncbi:TlpA family protein disulfide reductase [Polaribacter ponticola]|uniref:TlpA disulfide reductase family protein n=1 Tax=Polaribacter ponticola TaxID=2978475 RepID=A0ABT5SD39_9FLAO|nr:TlpA disulfide reductase family protein [Polaribacter sp. MSW5]MDD7915197.1 TlpA disulfide reductase family protein [Polaribacter sp. MSW5]
MKNIFALLLFVSSFITAQNTVKGVLSPKIKKSDWIILYKVEGTKQVFVNNTNVRVDSIDVNGVKQAVGHFEFKLPANAKPGAYRINYRLEGESFVDFFYNKEDVSFVFNPDYPEQTITFSESSENKLYKEYLESISLAQQKLDSIQVAVLQNRNLELGEQYKDAFSKVTTIQKKYEEDAKKMYVLPIIKASSRSNPKEILTNVKEYMSAIKSTYFDRLNFTNKTLINSSFLTNKILEYVFYINYSDVEETQQKLFKQSIETVLSKIKYLPYKKDVIEFLITQLETSKNLQIIDYLFEKHYYKLPLSLQSQEFISEKIALLVTEVGRTAPDFSWKENGKSLKLSTLIDAEKYVLVFWSTSCSHCLKEIPLLHTFMENKKDVKVIAFALENDSFVWENYSKTNLNGWHNVLGLNKWQNKIARTYQVYSTPTYLVLDKNKKIIAKPYEVKDVKAYFEKN